MTQEQTQQTPPDTDTADVGSLDAAARAFEQRELAEAQAEAETQASDETESPDDDLNAEADEADTDEDTEVELEEVVVAGFKLSVPKDQAEAIQKGVLMQAEFSRRMNDVSATEKALKQRQEQVETLHKGIEKYAEAMAEIRVFDTQLKQYEALDWQTLRKDDPAQYAAYAADLQSVRLSRSQAEMKARGIGQEVEQTKHQAFAEKRNEMVKTLQTKLKGWGDQMGAQITEYAGTIGVSPETLGTLTDPGLVIALDKARQFDALQASKVALKAKVKEAPPVLKPGVTRKQPNAQEDAMTQLRKFKTRDAAEVAFLARMK